MSMTIKDLGELLERLNLALHIVDSRYSQGLVAFVCGTEEFDYGMIEDYLNGGGDCNDIVTTRILDVPWFPAVYGTVPIDELLSMLIKKIGSIPGGVGQNIEWGTVVRVMTQNYRKLNTYPLHERTWKEFHDDWNHNRIADLEK